MHTSCPRCNMYLAPGTQVCPNCQLNLSQMQFQQQNYNYGMQQPATETRQEKKYRVLVIILACVSFAELIVYRLPDMVPGLYSLMRPLNYLLNVVWCAIPLAIALVLPKSNKVRVLMIVFGVVFAIWQLYFYISVLWMNDGYGGQE